ncbi:MAG: four helix bundle protein [Candidatus Marinimicrobia bacterium]|jgi:four helix bundle protein|nr:four helix bundle protein [Candidatus Neomarinimicrobiota bacterium]
MGKNVIQEKSYEFAVEVIRTYQTLKKEYHEYDLFRQFLRSGTSIGANIQEAVAAQSRKDFLSKVYISFKEARETLYWINLLIDTSYLTPPLSNTLKSRCEELIQILSSITKTTSESIKR